MASAFRFWENLPNPGRSAQDSRRHDQVISGQRRAVAGASGRVADASRDVADDEHHPVSHALEAGGQDHRHRVADVHVRGVAVDWASVIPAGQRVGLPTYAFEKRHFWLDIPAAPSGDAGTRRTSMRI